MFATVTTSPAATRRTSVTAHAQMHSCKCGCGTMVAGLYARGHDARHVSQIADDIAAAIAALPSATLRARAISAAQRRRTRPADPNTSASN